MMTSTNKEAGIRRLFQYLAGQSRVFLVLIAGAVMASVITFVLYKNTEEILKERLQERLIAIVATTATQFESDDILAIEDTNDINSAAFERLVDLLNDVKMANTDIQYAYLMRRTDDINTFEFIADAESLLTAEELDFDENGVVDDYEMVPMPGDPFDTSEYPTLRDEAFYHPVAADELEEDQWSVQLSAYAPIYDENEEAIAIVGIDVIVEDFNARTQAMLLPFLLFVIFLMLLLSLMTVLLVRFYGERVEALKEVDRQKDELLGIVSHQLATPVSSVKWYLEMMHDGDLGKVTKEQSKHIDTMQGVVSNLSDLVQMILDVSRLQLGRMKIDRAELDMQAFLKEIIDTIKPKADEKNIDFVVNISDKLKKGVIDKRLTHMTLENLLSNAVKYTPEKGKVTFNATLSGGKLVCSVKDTGCGIPEADQSKIFGKLYRASNVSNVNGNGFGLYVAKGAIESQGGTISFKSQENKGTTFDVTLPLE